MFVRRFILGGMVALGLGMACLADPLTPTFRPIAREDAVTPRVAAKVALLAIPRPAARPGHMVRYPAVVATWEPDVRPLARPAYIPEARWDNQPGSVMWTRAAMSAMSAQGEPLTDTVPRDIGAWCPAYVENGEEERDAFWVGMMSALAKHESTMNPRAVGGGGLWYGLLQILPDTAQRYGCHARTGAELTDPEANLACAVRIMARTVPRDDAIAVFAGRWRGVAADWGPMTNRAKIAEMSAWTSRQSYCQPDVMLRPVARPEGVAGPLIEARREMSRGASDGLLHGAG